MRKLSMLVIAALLLALVPSAAAQDDMMSGPNVIVTLEPTGFAEGAGLAGVTGWAHVRSDEASVHISLTPNGATLPEGTVLEGWVVDAGLDGGPGMTNVTDDDEAYGTSFGNADFDAAVEAAPYALSTGVLTATEDGTWELKFSVPGYNFSPYDAVVITLESDGDSLDGFDPRPGAPVFSGLIADGEPADDSMSAGSDESMDNGDTMGDESMGEGDTMGDESMGDESMDNGDTMGDESMGNQMMGTPVQVTLEPTPLAEGAGLGMSSGTAQVYVEDATIEITVNLSDAMLPEGTVLEGWVVDAGLDGGPGTTNVTDDDEAYGTSFGDANFDMLVESAPYAQSTGVLHDNMDGTLTLTFTMPAYNFSPYDAVVITLESDGDTTAGFDPRPGTPVLSGEIATMGM
jgi:hypothetical protein